MCVLRFGSAVAFGFAVATLSSQVFAQGAPSEPGRGPAHPAPPTPAASAKAPAPSKAPAAPTNTAAPAAAPNAKPAAPAAAASGPVPQAPSAPAVASGPVAVNAPDIVRLRNGGLLRGTISELVPGDYVTLVLITGETRKVAYADVQYAGAANAEAGAPAAPAAAATAAAAISAPPTGGSPSTPSNGSEQAQPFAVVHAKESVVNVVSKSDAITLFRRSASAGFSGVGTVSGYDEVCTTPCNVSMPAGAHTFAVAKAGGKPHEADAVVLPAGKATMTVSVIDRTTIRVGLGVLGLAGVIAGFAMVFSDAGDSSGGGDIAGPAVLAGLGAGAFGLAFAIPDGATVLVHADGPTANAAASRSNAWLAQRSRDAASLRNRPTGVTLSVRF
jgi:hypothetical protein